MSQSFVQLAVDGTGKKIDTVITATAAQHRQVMSIGDSSVDGNVTVVDSTGALKTILATPVIIAASNLCQSVTGASGAGVTATLPAVVGQFHYISSLRITKIFTVANTASATPLVITSTNLPGSLGFSFGQPTGVIGASTDTVSEPHSPIKSLVVNTATTIVCPATTGILWRVNVIYFAAP